MMTKFDPGKPGPAEQARLAAGTGAILRAERTAAGLSLTELGRRAGLGSSVVGKYERGESRPTPPTLSRLAMALRPGDRAAAETLARRMAVAAGSSLIQPTVPASVAREVLVAALVNAADLLGIDLDDERIRAVVVSQIRALAGETVGTAHTRDTEIAPLGALAIEGTIDTNGDCNDAQ